MIWLSALFYIIFAFFLIVAIIPKSVAPTAWYQTDRFLFAVSVLGFIGFIATL
jgi:hypothetical protein